MMHTFQMLVVCRHDRRKSTCISGTRMPRGEFTITVSQQHCVRRLVIVYGCFLQKSVIVHEIGHAVGFQHEQTRPDRDSFVRINYQNIQPNTQFNFQRYTTNTVNNFGVPYDYRSVMHYGRRVGVCELPTTSRHYNQYNERYFQAFSINGRDTVTTVQQSFQNVIGNARGLSFRDIKLANLMYNCNG